MFASERATTTCNVLMTMCALWTDIKYTFKLCKWTIKYKVQDPLVKWNTYIVKTSFSHFFNILLPIFTRALEILLLRRWWRRRENFKWKYVPQPQLNETKADMALMLLSEIVIIESISSATRNPNRWPKMDVNGTRLWTQNKWIWLKINFYSLWLIYMRLNAHFRYQIDSSKAHLILISRK